VKVLLDMNLSPTWVPFLRAAGVDSVHWSQVGDPRAPDAELMRWARVEGFIVFTHDMDFGALLAATRAHGPSVLQVRVQDTMPEAIGHDVLRVLRFYEEALTRGALVTLDKSSARVRILPFRGEDGPP
jgi:predicted nuclease of predicted toxin-antitoxin system